VETELEPLAGEEKDLLTAGAFKKKKEKRKLKTSASEKYSQPCRRL